MTIAMAIGPMIGLSVVQNYSFHGLFLLATLLSFMAVLLSLMAKMPFTPEKEKGKMQLFEKSVLSITIVVFFYHLHMEGLRRFTAICIVN